MALSRRDLLLGAAAVAVGSKFVGQGKMPKRSLGKMGWEASIYALGTAEIPANEEAIRAINVLLDGGVNYIDTAPSYVGSRSESAIGNVMKARRKEVFLATKTLARDADGAYREVQQSLERLQTKQIDLLQLHAINTDGELEAVLIGAVKGLERAKKDGLIRFIGITGHTRPEVFMKALDQYPFDSILVPVSALDAHISDFATEVVPKAKKLGISIVGMKCLKGIERAKGQASDVRRLIHYSLSHPVSTLTIGLRRESEAVENLEHFRSYKPMKAEDMKKLELEMKPHADTNHLWWKRR